MNNKELLDDHSYDYPLLRTSWIRFFENAAFFCQLILIALCLLFIWDASALAESLEELFIGSLGITSLLYIQEWKKAAQLLEEKNDRLLFEQNKFKKLRTASFVQAVFLITLCIFFLSNHEVHKILREDLALVVFFTTGIVQLIFNFSIKTKHS